MRECMSATGVSRRSAMSKSPTTKSGVPSTARSWKNLSATGFLRLSDALAKERAAGDDSRTTEQNRCPQPEDTSN
jgi:hypothetical protein